MANKTISMTKVRQILGYHQQAIGLKQICRLSGVSRNTVKRYIRQFIVEELSWADVERMSDYELDILFSRLADIQTDPRQEQLQAQLPAMEKAKASGVYVNPFVGGIQDGSSRWVWAYPILQAFPPVC